MHIMSSTWGQMTYHSFCLKSNQNLKVESKDAVVQQQSTSTLNPILRMYVCTYVNTYASLLFGLGIDLYAVLHSSCQLYKCSYYVLAK